MWWRRAMIVVTCLILVTLPTATMGLSDILDGRTDFESSFPAPLDGLIVFVILLVVLFLLCLYRDRQYREWEEVREGKGGSNVSAPS